MSYLFDNGRNAFLRGDIDWVDDQVRLYLVDAADYTPSQAAHVYLADVPAISREAEVVMGGKLTPGNAGIADANDSTFTAVTGAVSEYLVAAKWVTAEADSPLIFLIDSASGLPVTPNGGDIVVRWSELTNRIFKL